MPQDRTDGPTISRRTLARGAAWSVPVIAAAAQVPAIAASQPDVILAAAPCGKASARLNTIPFTVSTVHGARLEPGTVFTIQYAGGSTRPTWSGALAEHSDVLIRPDNDTSANGGRYGTILFTLTEAMPAETTWDVVITMDIGGFVSGQRTRFSLTRAIPAEANTSGDDDVAVHGMFFGGCRD